MQLWCSAEVEKTVLAALVKTEADLKSSLNSALNCSFLAEIDLELCYIPIIMGTGFIELYPPRSSHSKADNKVFHSPQLSIEVFESGTSGERENAYIKGLLLAKPSLCKAGLNKMQITKFEANLHHLLS